MERYGEPIGASATVKAVNADDLSGSGCRPIWIRLWCAIDRLVIDVDVFAGRRANRIDAKDLRIGVL